MKRLKNGDTCKNEIQSAKNYRDEVPAVVDQLVASCNRGGCFDHVSAEPIPHREAIIDILHRLALILYPGYFIRTRLDSVNLEYYLGQQMTALYEILSEQIILAIRHDCIRHHQSCVHCEPLGHQLTVEFLRKLPELRTTLARDIRASMEGDPAAKGYDEIIFSYPGIRAITVGKEGIGNSGCPLQSGALGTDLLVNFLKDTFRAISLFDLQGQRIVKHPESFVGQKRPPGFIRLRNRQLRHGHPVLSARSDGNRRKIFDDQDRIAGYSGLDNPTEPHIPPLGLGWGTPDGRRATRADQFAVFHHTFRHIPGNKTMSADVLPRANQRFFFADCGDVRPLRNNAPITE